MSNSHARASPKASVEPRANPSPPGRPSQPRESPARASAPGPEVELVYDPSMVPNLKLPIRANSDALVLILKAHPILWIGAGLSIAAGYPSTRALARILCENATDPVDPDQEFTAFVDAFVASDGKGALQSLVSQEYDGRIREPTPLHQVLARLAGRGVFSAIVTTNHDALIEDALKREGVAHVVQTLEQNATVGADVLRVFKVHGSNTDWSNAILSGASRRTFNLHYSFVTDQLDIMLQQWPIVFVGCSLRDPRILDWLAKLPPERAELLRRWRPMMTRTAWDRAVAASQAHTVAADEEPLPRSQPLALGNIRPFIIDDYGHLIGLWQEAAVRLTPGQNRIHDDQKDKSLGWTALLVGIVAVAVGLWQLRPTADSARLNISADSGQAESSIPLKPHVGSWIAKSCIEDGQQRMLMPKEKLYVDFYANREYFIKGGSLWPDGDSGIWQSEGQFIKLLSRSDGWIPEDEVPEELQGLGVDTEGRGLDFSLIVENGYMKWHMEECEYVFSQLAAPDK